MSLPPQDVLAVLRNYLRPYQREWLKDQSRKKICLKSRQIGMSETIVLEALLEALSQTRNIYFLSTNLSNAKDLIKRVQRWIRIFSELGLKTPLKSESSVTLNFVSGSTIQALPCRAESVRGKSGSIYLDECAHYQDDYALWAAIAPVVSSNQSLKIRILSTPLGSSGLFYDLWSGDDDSWSKHEISIWDAIDQGHNVDVDSLRQDYTEDQWAQEFELSFSSGSSSYYSPALIRSCLVDEDTLLEVLKSESLKTSLGLDPASVQDRASMTPLYLSSNLVYLGGPKSHQGISYPDLEVEALNEVDQLNADLLAVDQSGPGLGLTQNLRRKRSGVIGVSFTQQFKAEHCQALKRAMESGQVKILNHPELIADFLSVKESISASNNRIYSTPRTKKGHGDTFWAALVAWSSVAYLQGADLPVVETLKPPKPKPSSYSRRGESLPVGNYDYLNNF